MFKPRVVYAVLALALLWILAPPTAFAGSGARIVRLSYLDGGVEMDRGHPEHAGRGRHSPRHRQRWLRRD